MTIAASEAGLLAQAREQRILTWRWPWLYDAYFQLAPVAARVRRREMAAVLRHASRAGTPDDVVLEVGAGPGTYTRLLAERYRHVRAIDSEPGMLRRLGRTLDRQGTMNVSVEWGRVPGDLGPPGVASGLVAAGVLDYVEDLAGALTAMRRCVVPGGWMVFTVPSRRSARRSAALVEGVLAGRVTTRLPGEVEAAAADAGLENLSLEAISLGRTTYTLVGSVGVPGTALPATLLQTGARIGSQGDEEHREADADGRVQEYVDIAVRKRSQVLS